MEPGTSNWIKKMNPLQYGIETSVNGIPLPQRRLFYSRRRNNFFLEEITRYMGMAEKFLNQARPTHYTGGRFSEDTPRNRPR